MSTAAVPMTNPIATAKTMPLSRLLGAYITEAKFETLRMLRSPGFGIPFLTLPVALYLLFSLVIFGKISDPKVAMQLFIGFDVFGVMGPGMFGFGIIVAQEREQGLVTLKRAMPLPPAAYLAAKMAMALIFGLIVTTTMLAAALAVIHLPLTVAQCLEIVAINTLSALPFCSIGLFVGTRAGAKASPAITNIFYLAMIYLTGVFFPVPQALKAVVQIFPSYHLEQLTLRAVGQPAGGFALVNIAAMATLTVLLTALSVRRLSRVG